MNRVVILILVLRRDGCVRRRGRCLDRYRSLVVVVAAFVVVTAAVAASRRAAAAAPSLSRYHEVAVLVEGR